MNTKTLHKLSDVLMTSKKMHLVLNTLIHKVGEPQLYDTLIELLTCSDEDLDKLPNLNTIDPKKVEALVREKRKRFNNRIDNIVEFGPITDVDFLTQTIYYNYTQVVDNDGKVTKASGTYFYGDNSKSIML